jgi:hypothetical protein
MSKTQEDGLVAVITCMVFILLVLLFIGLGAFIFMTVWNLFIPVVFGGPTIDYVTALAGWVLLGLVGSAFKTTVSKK